MIDGNILITIVPPIFAAIIAYAIARIKSGAGERIQRAKIDAEVDTRAMDMVKSIMEEMKSELKSEISFLKDENKIFLEKSKKNCEEIDDLKEKLRKSFELQEDMKIEIIALKKTIEWYEKRLKEAIGFNENVDSK